MISDKIILDGIEVMAHVGVPDEERARPQRLEVSMVLHLNLKQAACTDSLDMSLDYLAVYHKTKEVVEQRPRCLIETVAEDIAQSLLSTFKISCVEVEVRKFILPRTRSVAVCITRKHH